MALKAGRVGVNKNQVDAHGNIIGGASDSYTKQQADAKFATKSSLTANSKQFYFDYDAETEKYGFRAGASGEFQPFSGGVFGALAKFLADKHFLFYSATAGDYISFVDGSTNRFKIVKSSSTPCLMGVTGTFGGFIVSLTDITNELTAESGSITKHSYTIERADGNFTVYVFTTNTTTSLTAVEYKAENVVYNYVGIDKIKFNDVTNVNAYTLLAYMLKSLE